MPNRPGSRLALALLAWPGHGVERLAANAPPRAGQRVDPAGHAGPGVLDIRAGEEILRLDLVDWIVRPHEIALVAERHGGIDAHAALESRVRCGPFLGA